MWPLIIGGLGMAIHKAQSQQYQNEYNQEMAEADREFQREMVESQRAWDLEQWNRQNEYNSPASQMERYRAAGLNPNIIYGSGNAIAGQASNHPTSSTPNMALNRDSVNIGTAEAFINMFGQLAQAEKLDSDTYLNFAKMQTELDTQKLLAAQVDEATSRKISLDLANNRTELENYIFSLPYNSLKENDELLRVYKEKQLELLGLQQDLKLSELKAQRENWDTYKTQNIDARWNANIEQLNKSDSDFSDPHDIALHGIIKGGKALHEASQDPQKLKPFRNKYGDLKYYLENLKANNYKRFFELFK